MRLPLRHPTTCVPRSARRAVTATADARAAVAHDICKEMVRPTRLAPSAHDGRRERGRGAFATPDSPETDVFLGGPGRQIQSSYAPWGGARTSCCSPISTLSRRSDRLVARSRSIQVH